MGTAVLTVPGNGQAAKVLTDFFPTLPSSFQGVLRITTSTNVAASGARLRFNERNELLEAGIPAVPEGGASETVLPHIAAGGGYETSFVLFDRTEQTNSGTVKFISQSGGSMAIISTRKGRGQIISQ